MSVEVARRLLGLDDPQELQKLIALAIEKLEQIKHQTGTSTEKKLEALLRGLPYHELEGLVNLANKMQTNDFYYKATKRAMDLGVVVGGHIMVFYPTDCKTYEAEVISVKKWTVKVRWFTDNSTEVIPIRWVVGVFE